MREAEKSGGRPSNIVPTEVFDLLRRISRAERDIASMDADPSKALLYDSLFLPFESYLRRCSKGEELKLSDKGRYNKAISGIVKRWGPAFWHVYNAWNEHTGPHTPSD